MAAVTVTLDQRRGRMILLAAIENAPQASIGWGTLALINAGLAQSKNRSGLNWSLVSLLLGPLATLLVVCLEKLRPRS